MDVMRKIDRRRGAIDHEVTSLLWLAEAREHDPAAAAAVPVLAGGPTWLEEPRLRQAPATSAAAEAFGRALAHTHAAGAPHLGCPPPGLGEQGWIGGAHLSLPARPTGLTWGAFHAEHRILPHVDSTFTAPERRQIEGLCERLSSGAFDHDQPALVEAALSGDRVGVPAGNDEGGAGGTYRAARIHGDLWSGNVMWTDEGAVLIDPAAQGGHAESDLAALALFGCPHLERIRAAYDEASPLAPGWRERIGLHQLHLLTVHCQLFGRGYVARAMEIVRGWMGTPTRRDSSAARPRGRGRGRSR
ncbi:fructosamine kinase family protein [Schaalia sp. 19OD2882]|uniref:fructosamine kinase family protein n=1 Tax=Schaalia sp. 19OD2882 TaxID=2794089 RepID=UPI001C1F1A75|nr:fructosamine kinase family protein [Schaalia sp. 19OD2882]QWW19494.1 fructosamine kinase family protein [Schaalia sp. 19OD2882]